MHFKWSMFCIFIMVCRKYFSKWTTNNGQPTLEMLFEIALIEALACGKPVIATDSGGPRDIIGDEEGLLIKDHNPVSFS